MQITEENLIQLEVKAKDWQEAINLSCQPLLSAGMISTGYIDGIFESVEKYGPYFILMENVAFPHCSNFTDVFKSGLAITVLKEAVVMKGKKIKILLTLASVSQTDHLDILSQLAQVLQREQIVEAISNCKSEREVLNLLEEK